MNGRLMLDGISQALHGAHERRLKGEGATVEGGLQCGRRMERRRGKVGILEDKMKGRGGGWR